MGSALDTRVQTRIRDAIRDRFTQALSFEVSEIQTDPDTAYDPMTGTATPGTTNNYSVRCSPLHRVSKRFLSQTVVETDQQVILPALGLQFTPSLGQTVTVGSDEFTVVGLERYDADTEAAAWAVVVRA